MRIRKISAGLGVTIQPRQYEAFRVDITLEAEVEEGEDARQALYSLREKAREEVELTIETQMRALFGDKAVDKALRDAT